MSDGLHDVEGYIVCGCGAWVVREVAYQQGGKCAECWAKRTAPLRVVEAMHRGIRVPVTVGRKRKRKSSSKGSRATHQGAAKAKMAALRRLRALYPEIYDMLYDEERVLRGLPPRFRPAQVDHEQAIKTYEVDPAYHPLLEGVMDEAHDEGPDTQR